MEWRRRDTWSRVRPVGNVHTVRSTTMVALAACLAAACAASVGCSSPPAEVEKTTVLDPSPDVLTTETDAGSPSDGGGGELSSMGGSGASGGPSAGGTGGGGASSTGGAPSIGEGGGGTGGGGTGGEGTGGEGATADLCDLPDAECGAFAPGSTGYYLLSGNEYLNTVRELVGNVSFSADALWVGTVPGVVGRESIAAFEDRLRLAAEEAAAFGAQQPEAHLACADDEERRGCVQRFVADFGARAWRGPLSLDEELALMAAYDDAASSGDEALAFESLLRAIFSSPRFFSVPIFGLRSEPTEHVHNVPDTWVLTPYEMASRLSYWLWQGPPDDELVESARDGGLIEIASIQAQVVRMMGDGRFSRSLDVVNDRWLRLFGGVEFEKDSDVFPEYTEEVALAMTGQALAFARSRILQEPAAGSSPWAGLFLDEHSDDDVLTGWYEGSPERRGVLTLPRVLATKSGPILTRPVARGLFVRSLLCQDIPPPPPIVPTEDPRLTDATLSARDRYAGGEDEQCVVCHKFVNPVGFAFEHYDAIGKYRSSELGSPIDASGQLVPFGSGASSNAVIDFDGVDDLSRHLASSGEAFACLGNRWLEHAGIEDACGARGAALSACRSGDIRELVVKLVASERFRFVSETDRGPSTPGAMCAQRGIMDCEALTSIDGVELSLEECVRCQGAQPGTDPPCDAFPFAGVAIIRGCCSDEDCEGLAPFCGQFTAPNGVCVQDDAI